MTDITTTKKPHKTSWTVAEIAERFNDVETKARWTTTQVRVLLERIAELEATEKQLTKERTFLLTLLDDAKTNNDSIKTAADMVGLKLPKTTKKK